MGVPIRVWVPGWNPVELVVGDKRIPMARHGDYVLAELPAGTDYLISVDGRDARPDPRSAWQPYGVHGPSRAFSTSAHAWGDGDWRGRSALGAVTYELHIGTFTPEGTLDSAIEKLGHLAELGIEMVELMPVAAFPGDRGWGYDGVGLWAVHEAYGGPAALQRFVDAAHQAGIGVCLDVVYNHLGPSGNYLAEFGPYFGEHQTPWGAGLDLDTAGSGPVRSYIAENALRWFRDFHIDALRLDAVHAIRDDSPVHILAELALRTRQLEKELGRPLSLVAESDLNDPRTILPPDRGGAGQTGQWADDVHHALHSYLTGESFGYYVDFGSADTLAHALTRVFVHDGGLSTFRGVNWGAPVDDDVDRRRFVVFTQNHDQVGNRATGDRPEATLPAGVVAAGSALLLLSPFTPMLFMGQEWAASTPFQYFSDHGEDIGPFVSEGRRAEFASHGWFDTLDGSPEIPDPQDPATFEASRLDWTEPGEGIHARMLAWHRDLIALRAEVFGDGAEHQLVSAAGEDGWFVMRRGSISVAVTPRDHGACVPAQEGELLLAWGEAQQDHDGWSLGAHSVAVIRH